MVSLDVIAGIFFIFFTLEWQDRRPINMRDLIEPPPPTELTQAPICEEEEGFLAGSSAKIDQLIHLLKLSPPTEKSLVFSQFTSFLDKVRSRQIPLHTLT
jgi:SWI/SNF-related matrix-associated actin-dependent regulator of chromatin subfamily A3